MINQIRPPPPYIKQVALLIKLFASHGSDLKKMYPLYKLICYLHKVPPLKLLSYKLFFSVSFNLEEFGGHWK